MLAIHPAAPDGAGASVTTLTGAIWVDLLTPTPEERALFENTFGFKVPSRDQVGEIEATSRLKIDRDAIYMTAPLVFAKGDEPWIPTPVGFVLSKNILLTLRFAASACFDTVANELASQEKFEPAFAFVRLLEELVDHIADLLEASSRDLDDASHLIFRHDNTTQLAREASLLRELMMRTGRISERMSHIHYSLVCLDRMTKFTVDRSREWLAHDLALRLQSISSDIVSLVQYSEGLVSRVQLLQDAATGIISIDQNEVMKVLTIASVVGIPPVLVAGIYGMNFKNMPEYDWAWGYPYALAAILVTALLPLIWFKYKDWI